MTEKLLILGASGFMGSAFVRECKTRGLEFDIAAGTRADVHGLWNVVADSRPSLVVNCSAFIPSPTVDACSRHLKETISGNVLLPTVLSEICHDLQVPLVHLSTGCIFDEQREYSETDTPTRGFEGYCGTYVGTKLLAEDMVRQYESHYILRLRLPFDELDHPRNYLSKLASFKTVFTHTNSLTHRGDFVKAALDLWKLRAAFGTYHVCNPGFVTAHETIQVMESRGIPTVFESWQANETTGCKLSTAKLLAAGVKIRTVHEALEDAVKNWRKA